MCVCVYVLGVALELEEVGAVLRADLGGAPAAGRADEFGGVEATVGRAA